MDKPTVHSHIIYKKKGLIGMRKRILASILAITMIFTMMPSTVFADEQIGDNTEAVETTETVEGTEAVEGTETIEATEAVESTEMTEATESVESTEKTGETTEAEDEIAVQSVESENEEEPLAENVTFMNDGYPYGRDMNNSSVTLVMDVKTTEGALYTYQWQSAASRRGEYTDIAGATGKEYTINSPVTGNWYRCVVNGNVSKSVETVHPGEDGRIWTQPYGSCWYISNGTMAYMVDGTKFDVTGLYIKSTEGVTQKYMLSTSYLSYWDMFSSTEAEPAPVGIDNDTRGDALLDALRVSFNDTDAYDIIFEADLAEGQRSFSYGCDTQLGNSSLNGTYADHAALQALLNKGTLKQISMIGSATVAGANEDESAFVIAPITTGSMFWIGRYNARNIYDYNTITGPIYIKKNETVNGVDNVVTLMEGDDSVMTMSWTGLESGSSVKFRFCVGSVKDTGAINGKVNYVKETLIDLEPGTDYEVTCDDVTYIISSDENGELKLAGTDNNGQNYDFIGKTIAIKKVDSEESENIKVVGRPAIPQQPSELGNESANTPERVDKIEIVELTKDSVSISPVSGQSYAYSKDGENWTTLTDAYMDSDGYYRISGLPENGKVYVRTCMSATKSSPMSEWSESTELNLKQTIKATAQGNTEIGAYDGQEHPAIIVTPEESDAKITYSLSKDGVYSTDVPKIKNAGTYTIYYRVEKEGYYPSCGSVDVTIESLPVNIEWSNTEFTYDGTSKLPTAKISGGILDGENCSVSVKAYYDIYSSYSVEARGADTYVARASLDNSNYHINDGETCAFTINQADRNAPILTGVAETISGKKDGKIEGLTYEMEYHKIVVGEDSDSQNLYTSVSNGNMTFESGTYKVRYEESYNYKASPSTTVTIGEGRKLTITLPDEQLGYTITSDVAEVSWNGKATLTFALNNDDNYTENDKFAVMSNGTPLTATEEDNTYIVNNIQEDQVITVTGIVDKDQPTGSIQIGNDSQNGFIDSDKITFNTVLKGSQHVKLTGNDATSGVKSVEYYIYTPTNDKNALTLDEVKNLDSWTTGEEFDIDSDTKCIIYAKITDKSGNVTYISSNGMTIDCTAPVISGADEDSVYCKNLELTVDDVTLESVTCKLGDSDEVKQLTAGENGKYTLPVEELIKDQHDIKDLVVKATDSAGNVTELTIKAGHEYKATVVEPTVLDKGYTLYECTHEGCNTDSTYKADYVPAKGTAGLVPNDKADLTDIVAKADAKLADVSSLTEEKAFYEEVKNAASSMLDDVKEAEEKKAEIDDLKISDITKPNADDSDKLNEALTKINDLLDADNKDTPTQSLTDAQKKELEDLRDSINEKLGVIAEAAEKLEEIEKGTSTEPGVETIDKITAPKPADQKEIESVLTKIEEYQDKFKDNLTAAQKEKLDADYEKVLNKLKEAAKLDVDKELESVKSQIEATFTDSAEKDAAISDAEAAAESAKAAIDNATTRADVVAERDSAKEDLDEMTGTVDAFKEIIKENVETTFNKKKAEIEAMTDLTDSDRSEAIRKLEAEKNRVLESIDSKKSKDDVVKSAENIEDDLDDIVAEASETDLSNAKDSAKADIDKKAAEAKEAIDKMTDLTDSEKKAAKADIDSKAEAAKKAIDDITDPADKDSVASEKASVSIDIDKSETEASDKNTANVEPNAEKAEAAIGKTTEIVGDIKVSKTDKDAIVSEIEKELKASEIENAAVDISDYKKIPASLHEAGKVTGTVEITVGSTTKTIEIVKELPKLSSYVSYESTVASDAPKAEVSVDKDALMTKILGEEVLEALANGSNADITLDVQNKDTEVTAAEAAAIDSKLTDGTKVGKYLDISLFLKVVDSEGETIVDNERIHEAETTFTIKVSVPEELWASAGAGRIFHIVRVHDGVAEVLDSVYDETEHTLTFETDRFSTYAIAYTDAEQETDTPDGTQPTENQPAGNQPNGSQSENDQPVNSNQPAAASTIPAGKASPKTGDDSTAWPFVMVMLAGLGVLALGRRKAQNIK